MDPTTDEWRELYTAFADFCGSGPWRFLEDRDVVIIEGDLRGEQGYAIVTGAAGITHGLALYLGDGGLAAYRATMSAEVEPESDDAFDMLNALWAVRADREELLSADRAVIRTLGLRFRGRGAWPLFRRLMPGYAPWHIDTDEAVFLTRALRAVTGMVAVAARSGPPGGPTLPGVTPAWQLLDGAKRGGTGQRDAPHPESDPSNELRLRRLAASRARSNSVWEVGSFYLHAAVQERRSDRPYYPTVVLAVDGRSGLVLGAEILGERPSAAERRECLVDLLERAEGLPAEIVVESPESARLVDPIAKGLGIRLSIGGTPALAEARDDLRDRAGG